MSIQTWNGSGAKAIRKGTYGRGEKRKSVVWENLLKRSNITNEDTIHEWAFPLENYRRHIVIGFPVE